MGSRGAFQDVDTGKFNFVENGQNYHTVGDVDGVQVILQNSGMIARGLSLAALIYTFTLELIKTLKLYYDKNNEWENNLEEQIKKIKSDSITKF